MRRVVLLVAVLITLVALARDGEAADLQAEWYVKIYGVGIYSYDYAFPYLPYLRSTAQFLTTPDQYGPFTVSDGALHTDSLRYVNVKPDFVASPSQSLILPLYTQGVACQETAYYTIDWGTNYDPNQIKLEF